MTELLCLAEDGQHMFLHPVNVRCLVREYGSLEQSPEKISATVVEIAGYSMSEDVRQRHRYLSHLPLTCEFSICELALQPPVVSKETLEIFSDDIEKRKRQRQKKAREERRRERRIEMEENKRQGRCKFKAHICLLYFALCESMWLLAFDLPVVFVHSSWSEIVKVIINCSMVGSALPADCLRPVSDLTCSLCRRVGVT